MALWGALYAIAVWGALSDAIPMMSFPLNSQVPPVARVSEPFSYTFSSSTFSSAFPMTYNISDAPAWLSLDSTARTLSGTPSLNDVGANQVTGVNIGLVANDATGSVTMNATIVISKSPSPQITNPLSAQLPSLGLFSLPATLLYHPSTPFKLNFDPRTFSGGDGASNFTYYAVTDNNTPLPSWITFDTNTFSFSGETPDYASLIQPPQSFGMKLIASDVEGFAGASMPFSIEVGIHLFAFKNANLILNATAGSQINFDGLSNNLELDGQMVNKSSLTSITAQTPSWLSFENSTLLLRGSVPSDATPGNVTVVVTDIYGDTANAVVSIEIPTSIFSADVAPFNATIGAPFSHDLASYVNNKADVEIAVTLAPPVSWAAFDPQTFILSGDVPSDTQISVVNITMNVTSKSLKSSDTQSFALSITTADSVSGTTPIHTTPSASRLPTTTPMTDTPASQKRLSKAIIAAIVAPVVLAISILVLLLAIVCFRRRRRESKNYINTPKIGTSTPMRSSPSMAKIASPSPVMPPPPLQLDTSGFGSSHRSSVYSNRMRTASNGDKSIKRSQTVSGASGAVMAGARRPDTAGTTTSLATRTRAHSETTTAQPDTPNWRLAQNNSYPTIGSRTRSNSATSPRLSRTYSNYSRKGHSRRTGRIWSPDPALRDSVASNEASEATSILGLKDSDFAIEPLDKFSTVSQDDGDPVKPAESKAGESVEKPSPVVSRTKRRISKMQHRQQKVASPLERTRAGVGHGGRESISSVTSVSPKRRSIGHGNDWGMSRDSRTWMTVTTGLQGDEDTVSRVSRNTDETNSKRTSGATDATSKDLMKGPASEVSGHVRPISRRVIGESPFFSGGFTEEAPTKRPSIRMSKQPPMDSPTVPEVPAMTDIKSYGSTKESTKQLRSYIQSRSRSRTMDSMDSRFESASPSMQSMYPSPEIRGAEVDVEMRDADEEYEDFLPDDLSDGSWETSHSPERVSPVDVSAPAATASEGEPSKVLNPLDKMQLGVSARIMQGRGRRPESHDQQKLGSVRGLMGRDDSAMSWTAYV